MRAVRRRREIAVRVALGVSRPRLVAQLVAESTLLAVIAGGVALLVAQLTGDALRVRLSTSLRWTATVVDHRVVLVAMGCAVVAGVLAGLAPAVVAFRADLASALRASGTTRVGSTLRAALLVTQAALCMALLACEGAFLQSLRHAAEVDRGFDAEHTVKVSLPGYFPNSEQQIAAVTARLREIPDVVAVGRSYDALGKMGFTTKVGPSWKDTIGVGPRGPSLDFVEPAFMQAAGLRLVAGRTLTDADAATPVVVINESLATALWPGQPAVGRCIHVREPGSPCRTIVGVVRDVRWDLTEPSLFQLYVPHAQAWTAPNPALIPDYLYVRMRVPPSAADVARLQAAIAPLVLSGGDFSVRRVGDLLEPLLRPWRLAATLFLILGALGLVAAAAGIYGLVAYDVTQRSRELGVRMALGATAPRILGLVVGSGLRVVLLGLGAGTVAALVAGHSMASLLFATSPYDVSVLAGTALTLAAVTVLASGVPAWRAVRVSPVIALSSE
jgi:predicted permease